MLKKLLIWGATALVVLIVIGAVAGGTGETPSTDANSTTAEEQTDLGSEDLGVDQEPTEEPAEEPAEKPAEEPAPESEPKPKPEPKLTVSQENALESAESYVDFGAFSRKGLIGQLSSEYGEGFPKKDAVFAVNHLKVDWKAEALESAKSYLDTGAFSRQGLIDQLTSEYGEQFTLAEATYAVNKVGL
jgi:hypothetical protein